MEANYSRAEFLQPYPSSWREWILSLRQFTSFTKREIRHFHELRRTVDGKEMYKKAWCSCKVVVLPCQAIAYLTFLSPPHLKLPIIYDTLWSVKNRIFSGQIQLLLLIASQTFFFDSSVVPSFLDRKVEKKSFPCTHRLGERARHVWRDNSCRVRTLEKNSGEAVRRLGTIIQSILCAQ